MKVGTIQKTMIKPAYGKPRMRFVEVIEKTRYGTWLGVVVQFGYTVRLENGRWAA